MMFEGMGIGDSSAKALGAVVHWFLEVRQRDGLGPHQTTLDAVPTVADAQGPGLETGVDLPGGGQEGLLKIKA